MDKACDDCSCYGRDNPKNKYPLKEGFSLFASFLPRHELAHYKSSLRMGQWLIHFCRVYPFFFFFTQ